MSLAVVEYEASVPAVLPSGTPGPPIEPKSLHQSQVDIISKLQPQLDTTVFRLMMSAQTAGEFRSLRTELFQKYIYLSGAIGNIIKNDLSKGDLADALDSAYVIVEDYFAKDVVLFGGQEEARGDALYSVDALHRSHALLCQMVESSLSGTTWEEPIQAQAAKLLMQTMALTWFALMHLHAIIFAIENRLMLSSEVFRELLCGLRSSTRAYISAREAWGLRFEPLLEGDTALTTGHDDAESAYLAGQSDCEYRHFLELNPTARP